MFSDMFALPSLQGALDRTTDEAPLPLSDDTADEFRAMCWIMYALYVFLKLRPRLSVPLMSVFRPGDIPVVERNTLDLGGLSRILSLALFAHKYQFVHIEKWALGFLEHHSILPRAHHDVLYHQIIQFPTECSHRDFLRLIQYSMASNHSKLQSKILSAILTRVDSDPRSLELVDALSISEEYQWRDMQGKICYRILCEAVKAASNERESIECPHSFQAHLPQQLSEAQVSRILQGFFSLNVVHDHIMRSFQISQPMRGSIKNGTQPASAILLNTGGGRNESVDVLGRLQSLSNLSHSGHLPGLSYVTIENYMRQVEENLPNYFLGAPTPI